MLRERLAELRGQHRARRHRPPVLKPAVVRRLST